MITITNLNRFNSTIEIYGLSTDERPIEKVEYKGVIYTITNSSTFYEMDTKKVYIYDEENHEWDDV